MPAKPRKRKDMRCEYHYSCITFSLGWLTVFSLIAFRSKVFDVIEIEKLTESIYTEHFLYKGRCLEF